VSKWMFVLGLFLALVMELVFECLVVCVLFLSLDFGCLYFGSGVLLSRNSVGVRCWIYGGGLLKCSV
jgi:hypothetical protein